ncbi:unnamed protein product [Lactuca saligna]|uniref:Uncharacterized protein n=1 Tax=Lactuca saligna TaxID=75948 RepID=A0AA36E1W4_LACSI|nr:unnamed protein product [Lactuca saligna]
MGYGMIFTRQMLMWHTSSPVNTAPGARGCDVD